jgi:hypothetical protein
LIGRRSLSIDDQVADMKATWSTFAVRNLDRSTQSARWISDVRAQYCNYRIEVRYQLGMAPQVRVLTPKLVRLPGNAEGQLPHVYPPAEDPTLCLFDPRDNEWNASMFIARTTVPWSLDWLACYELWLMTGRWTGGGRHAGETAATTTVTGEQ